jgi:hypothetical protein
MAGEMGTEVTTTKRSELSRRLMWSGLVAGLGALATTAAARLAAVIWRRAFNEEPPE